MPPEEVKSPTIPFYEGLCMEGREMTTKEELNVDDEEEGMKPVRRF